jgi:flavodoxin
MKTVIVYISVHHKNTEKIAEVMAEELGADLVSIGQAQPETLTAFEAKFRAHLVERNKYRPLLPTLNTR